MEAAQAITADRFLLGVTGIHESAGLTTGDADEAAMKRALASRAGETFVLGSSEKIGAVSRYAVLPFADIAGVIVDGATPTTEALARLDVRLLHAQ
jgi:DeoR/GlpR family transcriptional regulator of sugar metabolism